MRSLIIICSVLREARQRITTQNELHLRRSLLASILYKVRVANGSNNLLMKVIYQECSVTKVAVVR